MKIPFRKNKKSTYFFFEAAVIKMEPQRKDTFGLLTVTSKALIYAPMNDSAFTKNQKWKHNSIHQIASIEKNQFEFLVEGSNEKITFQSDQIKKITKLIKKQQKIAQKIEKNSSSSSGGSSDESTEYSDKIGIPLLTEKALILKHENYSENLSKTSLTPSTASSSSCKNMALPPEPVITEHEYVNIRKEHAPVNKLQTVPENEDFKRYTLLPTSNQRRRSETMHNLSSYANNEPESSLPNSQSAYTKDDFMNLKEIETEIAERRSIIEQSKTKNQSRRPFSVVESNDRLKKAKTLQSSSTQSVEEENTITYANLPNNGLYANGIGPIECMIDLSEYQSYLQYADLDLLRSKCKKAAQCKLSCSQNDFSTYSKIDFISTNALRMTAEGQV